MEWTQVEVTGCHSLFALTVRIAGACFSMPNFLPLTTNTTGEFTRILENFTA